MKYLVVSLLHPKIVRGGAQQVAYELFQGATDDKDVDAHLVAAIDPGLPNANVPPGAVFTGLDNAKNENLMIAYDFDFGNHLQNNWFVIEKVVEFFEKNHFDWVHFHHSLFVGLEMLEIVKRCLPNAKIFYTLHEYLPICMADGQLKKRYNKSLCFDPSPQACFKCFPDHSVDYFFLREQLFKKYFDLVDHFVTPSEFTRDVFVRWGIPEDKISVIPNGQKNLNEKRTVPSKQPVAAITTPVTTAKDTKTAVATRAKENTALKNKIIRFGFFGQMIDNKGVHVILEAVKVLIDRDESLFDRLEINFYGGNKQFASEEYRKKIDDTLDSFDSDTLKKLRFHGEFTHEQLPVIFNSIDCVITPSTWFEVFGLVVSEAWMFGKPVIASDIGGLSERIQHGRNGLKFRANDPYDLADAMETFVNDYVLAGKSFPDIRPPLDQNEFWTLHKRLFERVSLPSSKVA